MPTNDVALAMVRKHFHYLVFSPLAFVALHKLGLTLTVPAQCCPTCPNTTNPLGMGYCKESFPMLPDAIAKPSDSSTYFYVSNFSHPPFHCMPTGSNCGHVQLAAGVLRQHIHPSTIFLPIQRVVNALPHSGPCHLICPLPFQHIPFKSSTPCCPFMI